MIVGAGEGPAGMVLESAANDPGALRLTAAMRALLRCPACRGELDVDRDTVSCVDASCGAVFPVVEGVPVLIDDRRGMFRRADVVAEMRDAMRRFRARGGPADVVRSLTPSLESDRRMRPVLERLRTALAERSPAPRVLLLGGNGLDASVASLRSAGAELARTDVVPGPGSDFLADPNNLPFPDGAFDAVIVHRVLNRLPDPRLCVDEVHRVLADRGLVLADTPFLRPVHLHAQDYQRFTHLGHRRLFRRFEELDSGASAGPGTVLAWSWRYFLWSFGRGRVSGFLLRTLADFSGAVLSLFDSWLADRPRALDAAPSVYFLGARGETAITDRELLSAYRGASPHVVWSLESPRPFHEVFSTWAVDGRDEGMERNHARAVEEMLRAALRARGDAGPFTAIDAGCGNGWVVRRLRAFPDCRAATGVDGSAGMIARARSLDPEGNYVLADLLDWSPPEPVDLVHAMEVLYYFEDPVAMLRRMRTDWLRPGAWAVFGLDHYLENEASLAWPTRLGVRMTTWSAERWEQALAEAGFRDVRSWRAAAAPGDPGTLVLLARTPR